MKKAAVLILFTTILFADSNVSGKVFFNHTTDLGEDGINAFNMKRAYLSYGNSVSDDVSFKLTYDMGKNESESAHTAFLKIAMVKWKTNIGDVAIGMQGMNMFKTMENTWGHRFIAKMPMDTYGFSASADLGVGIIRSFGKTITSALITNGGGYKKIESDSHKKFSFHTVYGESKLNQKDGFNIGGSFSFEPYDVDSITVDNTKVMGLFSGFSIGDIRIGGEFDQKITNITEQIISGYVSYNITEKIEVLVRMDQYDSDTNYGLEEASDIIFGLNYAPEKGFRIAPTLRRSSRSFIMTRDEGWYENFGKTLVVNFLYVF